MCAWVTRDDLNSLNPAKKIVFKTYLLFFSETPELEGDQEILRYNLQITAAEEGVTPSLLELHTIDQLRCTIPALQPGCAYRFVINACHHSSPQDVRGGGVHTFYVVRYLCQIRLHSLVPLSFQVCRTNYQTNDNQTQ